jgi:hypothetical protein
MRPVELELQGKTYFDFFLFSASTEATDGGHCPWLEIVETMIEAKKTKFLIHPLFELFMHLKWQKNKNYFYCLLSIVLFYQVLWKLHLFLIHISLGHTHCVRVAALLCSQRGH